MTLALNLTPEQEARLAAEAERAGLSVEDLVLRKALDGTVAQEEPLARESTGARGLAESKADDAIGGFEDLSDSPALPREWLEKIESGQEPTGAELVEQLRASGVLGTFADRPDSPEFARQLRREASRRLCHEQPQGDNDAA